MDLLLIGCIGVIDGMLFGPVYNYAYWRVVRLDGNSETTTKGVALMFGGTVVSCIAIALMLVVPLALFGFLPLGSRAPYFGWPMMLGAVVSVIWVRLRRSQQPKE